MIFAKPRRRRVAAGTRMGQGLELLYAPEDALDRKKGLPRGLCVRRRNRVRSNVVSGVIVDDGLAVGWK